MNEVQQAVTLQHFFPEVAGGVALGILGIACTTCDTRTVGALIEGQEAGSSICQLGGHPRFIQINSKVDQETVVQTEGKFFGTAVVLVLIDGAYIVLPGELVFQFQRHYGDAIDGQHHVDGVGVGGGVAELPGAAEDIRLIAFHSKGVQIRFRLKEADL